MREGNVLIENLVELFLKTNVLSLQGMCEGIVVYMDVQVTNKNDLISLSTPLTKELKKVCVCVCAPVKERGELPGGP